MKTKNKQSFQLYQRLKSSILDFFYSFKNPDMSKMVVLCAIVGIIGGLGSVIFYNLIGFFQNLFFGPTASDNLVAVVRELPTYYRILIPALGGLIIGPLIFFFAPEAKGHGVPEVMEAVILKGGKIRGRVAPFKALVSAICIGSGGSTGAEGPIVQTGAAFGSFVGQILELDSEKIETLLGAGAAAGIAGTFNAPLAGVMFSMEVLLKDIKFNNFSPIVVASVIGTGIANFFFGDRGAIFSVPEHVLVSFWEIIPYLLLGVLGAVVAIIFENSLESFEHFFEDLSIPDWIKPAIGGLLLGGLALYLPEVHSTGYGAMEGALHDNYSLQIVIILMFAKILATNFTLGSGGSGGIFAPSLFIGAMLGSAYGKVVHSLFPTMTAGASSYALVGTGVVFAGATHAPLTAIVILFEMTHDPRIILPLMFSCIISTIAASKIQKKNIYTTKFLERGIDIDAFEKETILKNVKVTDVMNTKPIKAFKDDTIEEIKEIFDKTLYSCLPVVNEQTMELIGILNHHQVFKYWDLSQDMQTSATEIAFPPPVFISQSDSLFKAMQLMNELGANSIPVVEDDESHRLVGVLNHKDITEAYEQKTSLEQAKSDFDYSLKSAVEVEKLVSFALDTLETEIEDKQIEIDLDVDQDLSTVRADSNKISWVMTHLLSNAIRYTPEGAKIEIVVHQIDDWITISVKDSGPGIPKEDQEKIFERFVSLDEQQDNPKTGLGLAISKEIIEEHGGHIYVDSEPGEGSTFIFSLQAFSN